MATPDRPSVSSVAREHGILTAFEDAGIQAPADTGYCTGNDALVVAHALRTLTRLGRGTAFTPPTGTNRIRAVR